jgi:hypothetical protein
MTQEQWEALSVTDRSRTWDALTKEERDKFRSLSGLNSELTGLEGWRVEATTDYGETRRFIVGRSSGWAPCHIELKTRGSMGGHGASRKYTTVRKLYKVR